MLEVFYLDIDILERPIRLPQRNLDTSEKL